VSDTRGLMMAQRLAPDDMTNRYNTQLDPAQEFAYQQWLQQQSAMRNRDMSQDSYDYDMRGAYQQQSQAPQYPSTFTMPETGDAAPPNPEAHFTDRFKKPNHPTFSDQSQYQGADGQTGGIWASAGGQGGQTYFQPGPANMQQWGQGPLQAYFKRVEPKAALLSPDGGWKPQ
jgi:hypothetical protein